MFCPPQLKLQRFDHKTKHIIVHLQFSSDNLCIVWSQDTGTDINEETWKAVLNRVYSSSLCTRHRLIQCKVVHRAHWSKNRLACINNPSDPECDRCQSGSATLIHMFWSCMPCPVFLLEANVCLIASQPLWKSHFVQLLVYLRFSGLATLCLLISQTL